MPAVYWAIFKEINKSIFRFGRDKASLVSLIGTLIALGGAVASFSKAFDTVVKYIVGLLISDQRVKDLLVTAISREFHVWPKIVTALSILVVFYLILFSYHAFRFSVKMKKRADEENEEKQRQASSSDYRGSLAAAIGLKFQHSRYFYEILDFDGNAKMMRDEAFSVTGLRLHHLVRMSSSTCAEGRSGEFVKVEGLPAGVHYDPSFQMRGTSKIFNIYFAPALERTATPVTLRTGEDIQRSFLMYREAIQLDGWSLDEPLESVSHMVVDATELVEMTVTFPLGYQVTERSFYRVRYDASQTPHTQEEKRLHETPEVVKPDTLPDGRFRLTLSVPNPVMGLRYFLCWLPPKKVDFEALKTTSISKEKPAPEKPTSEKLNAEKSAS